RHQGEQENRHGHQHFQERKPATSLSHGRCPSDSDIFIVTTPVMPRKRRMTGRVPRAPNEISTRSSRAEPSGRNVTTVENSWTLVEPGSAAVSLPDSIVSPCCGPLIEKRTPLGRASSLTSA